LVSQILLQVESRRAFSLGSGRFEAKKQRVESAIPTLELPSFTSGDEKGATTMPTQVERDLAKDFWALGFFVLTVMVST
jgi:hypothetical protein